MRRWQAVESELSRQSARTAMPCLRSIIQVAKNDKAGAVRSARKATDANAANLSRLAGSVLCAAGGNSISRPRSKARSKASSLQPASATGTCAGRGTSAVAGRRSARRRRQRGRRSRQILTESHAHSMLGFVHLAEIDTSVAPARISRAAIERDSFSALPRLGLGLAMIRDGELKAGREADRDRGRAGSVELAAAELRRQGVLRGKQPAARHACGATVRARETARPARSDAILLWRDSRAQSVATGGSAVQSRSVVCPE